MVPYIYGNEKLYVANNRFPGYINYEKKKKLFGASAASLHIFIIGMSPSYFSALQNLSGYHMDVSWHKFTQKSVILLVEASLSYCLIFVLCRKLIHGAYLHTFMVFICLSYISSCCIYIYSKRLGMRGQGTLEYEDLLFSKLIAS